MYGVITEHSDAKGQNPSCDVVDIRHRHRHQSWQCLHVYGVYVHLCSVMFSRLHTADRIVSWPAMRWRR
jgi:hypothetical protein